MQVIDWDLAVTTGTRLVRPGPQVSREEARQAVTELRTLSREAEGHVREFTKIHTDTAPQPATVVDRPGWIKANVEGFRVVLEPLTQRMGGGANPPPAIVTAVGSRITGVEVGAVLAFLASRVLGQYELFLPPDPTGQEPTGRLTLVAPNIVHAEREMGVDPHDFRLWVCLHEETHRVQFTAVPWMTDHLRSEMANIIGAVPTDPAALVADAVRRIGDLVTGKSDGSLLDLFSSPEQKAVIERVTGVMSLLEGHADVVMDGVGPEIIPSVDDIRRKFTQRRKGVGGLDRLLRRLLGLDQKMAQYRDGAVFVRAAVDKVGMDGFNAVWAGPANLPTKSEILDPALWIARVHG